MAADNIARYLESADDELRLAPSSSRELGRAIHRDFAASYLQRVAVLRTRAAGKTAVVQATTLPAPADA